MNFMRNIAETISNYFADRKAEKFLKNWRLAR